MMMCDLTSGLSEIQNEPGITKEHIEELKKDIDKQEKEVDERATKVNELVQAADRIFRDWKIKSVPTIPAPAPVMAPTVTTKRRFIPIDGFKPKTLSIEANYEDWIDFRKRFLIYAKACYESVPPTVVYTSPFLCRK